ncbi:MAG: 23S rRNA (adenine(2503)-C(2))-methyltransferase RlmN [Candidatus Omnitrophota bacterium]
MVTPVTSKQDIKSFLLEELVTYFEQNGLARYIAGQVFNWIYDKRCEEIEAMSNLSKSTRQFLKHNFYFSTLKLIARQSSCDGSEKLLFGLPDNSRIEAVLIPERNRYTLCVSSQVGCKYNCTFCLSGASGFRRNLSVSEIVNQYLVSAAIVKPQAITNIVFMGIGEPLDNFTNLVSAIKILMSPEGLGLGKRRICVSTCGLVPQIKKLAALKLGIKLSISLHAPSDGLRDKIMPVNKKYPLTELIQAVKEYSRIEQYPVTFEYALLSRVNTSGACALALAALLRGLRCKLNLIPYNKSSLEFHAPDAQEIADFTATLKKKDIFFTLRKPRGTDINAACGQLRAIFPAEKEG